MQFSRIVRQSLNYPEKHLRPTGSVLDVLLVALPHERLTKALDHSGRHRRLADLVEFEPYRVAVVRSAWLHGCQQVAVHVGAGEFRLLRAGRQRMAHRAGAADDPPGQHPAVLAPIGGVEYTFHDEV